MYRCTKIRYYFRENVFPFFPIFLNIFLIFLKNIFGKIRENWKNMGKLGKCWEKIVKKWENVFPKIVSDKNCIRYISISWHHKYIIFNIFSFSFAKAVITFDLHLDLHPLRMEMMICDFTSRILFRPRIYCSGLLIWFYYCYYINLHRHTNFTILYVRTLCTFCAQSFWKCTYFSVCTFCSDFALRAT